MSGIHGVIASCWWDSTVICLLLVNWIVEPVDGYYEEGLHIEDDWYVDESEKLVDQSTNLVEDISVLPKVNFTSSIPLVQVVRLRENSILQFVVNEWLAVEMRDLYNDLQGYEVDNAVLDVHLNE